jgi:hypothetical protein
MKKWWAKTVVGLGAALIAIFLLLLGSAAGSWNRVESV